MCKFTKKEIKILTFLSKQNQYTSAQNLAIHLGISIRSVKTYIKNINTISEDSIISTHKGYKLNPKKTINLEDNISHIPQTKSDRFIVIFKELLINEKTYNIEDLSNKLCISSDTMLREIRELNVTLEQYMVKIVTDNSFIFIKGQEKNKRDAISNFIINDIKNSIFDFKIIEQYYPNFDISTLQNTISSVLKENSYFLDDFSVFNLILHLIIVADRVINGHSVESPKLYHSDMHIPSQIYEISTLICKKIEKNFHIKFLDEDIFDFTLLLCTRLRKINDDISITEFLEKNIESDIYDLLKKIELSTKETYNLSFDNNNLKLRFYIHIKNLIYRINNNIKIVNPMVYEIKKHIYIYDVAIFIASIISKEYKILLSDDEIAYIAIHLILSFNEEILHEKKLNVILICPNYGDLQSTIKKKIYDIFNDDLIIIATLGQFPKNISYNYDFVISTIDSNIPVPYPFIKINTLFKNKDILSISQSIAQIKIENEKINFLKELQYFFKEDFFYYTDSKNLSKTTIFNLLSSDLVDKNYVTKDFNSKLCEREELYSSAYNNIAIPHPLEHIALKSTIAVYIVPNGAIWDNNKIVNIIFMLALTQEDQKRFKRIFDIITELLVDAHTFNILLKQKNYRDFITSILNLYIH